MIRSNTNWVCLRESEDEDGNEDGEKSRTKGNRIKDRKKKTSLNNADLTSPVSFEIMN